MKKRIISILCTVVMLLSMFSMIVVPTVAETFDLSSYTIEYKTKVSVGNSNVIFAATENAEDTSYYYAQVYPADASNSSNTFKIGHMSGKHTHYYSINGGTLNSATTAFHEHGVRDAESTLATTYKVKVSVTDIGTDAATAKLWVAADGTNYATDPVVTLRDTDMDIPVLGERFLKSSTTILDDLKIYDADGMMIYENDFSTAHPFVDGATSYATLQDGWLSVGQGNIAKSWAIADLIQYNTETYTIEYEESILEGFPGFIFSGTGLEDYFVIHPKPEMDILQVFHLGDKAKDLHKFNDENGEVVEETTKYGNHSISAPYDFEQDGRSYKFKVVITPATETEIGIAKIYINDSAEPVVTFKDSMITYGMIGTRLCRNNATATSVLSHDKAYFDNLKITDATGKLIYANDFSSYNFLTNSWMENGKVYQEQTGTAVIQQIHNIDDIITAEKAFDPAAYSTANGNYIVEYDIEAKAGNPGVVFSLDSAKEFSFFNVGESGMRIYDYRASDAGLTFGAQNTSFNALNTVKHVKLDVAANSVTATVDGKTITQSSNVDFLNPGFGFRLCNATDTCYVDNLTIKTPNGILLYENDFSAHNPLPFYKNGKLENGRLYLTTTASNVQTAYLELEKLLEAYTLTYDEIPVTSAVAIGFGTTVGSNSKMAFSSLEGGTKFWFRDYNDAGTPAWSSTANADYAYSYNKKYSFTIHVAHNRTGEGTSKKAYDSVYVTVTDGTNSSTILSNPVTVPDMALGFRHCDANSEGYYDNIKIIQGGNVLFEEDFENGYNPFAASGATATIKTVEGSNWIHLYGKTTSTEAVSTLITKQNCFAAAPVASADYAAVEDAIAKANILTAANYKNFAAVTEAIEAVDYTKTAADQAVVNGYAADIEAAIAALELKDADYTALNAAIAKYEGLTLANYTEATVEAATAAYNVAKADSGRKITDQALVTMKATNLDSAITALALKDADYTAVNTAKETAAALNPDYYDATEYAKVTEAVNAVVEGKKITEQAEVDAMAQAINDAIAALELLPANYAAVEAAKGEAAAIDRDLYTPESLALLDEAIDAVVEGKKIDEQAVVDGWAADIRAAIEDLDLIPVATPGIAIADQEVKAGETVEVVIDLKDNAYALSGMQIDIAYDAEYLSIEDLDDIVKGDLPFKMYVFSENASDNPAKVIMITDVLEGVTGNGSLVKLTFKARKEGTTAVTATINSAEDVEHGAVTLEGGSGTITIEPSECQHEGETKFRHVDNSETHIEYCVDCGADIGTAAPCTIDYAPAGDHLNHTATCPVCSFVYTAECDYDDGVVTTEPTCEGKGVKTFTCAICSDTYTEDIDPINHDWDEGAVTTEPTCEGKGVKTYTCKNDASHTYTEDIDPIGHAYDEGVVTTKPTCEGKGVKTFTCANDASHTYTEDIDPIGHDWNTEADTTNDFDLENGKHVHNFVCKNDASHIDARVVDLDIVETPATCEDDAFTTYTCPECDHAPVVVTQDGTAKGHDWDEGVVTTEPTCEGKGEKTYTCKNDASHTYTEEIDPTGHAYDEGVVTTKPTCEGKGVKTFTCANDASHTYTEDIDPIGHDWGAWTHVANTATHTRVCANDAAHTETVACVTAQTGTIGHTCTEDGKLVYTCTENCGYSYTETNPADPAGHTYDEGVYTEATCTKDAYTTYTCSVCDENTEGHIKVETHAGTATNHPNKVEDTSDALDLINGKHVHLFDCPDCDELLDDVEYQLVWVYTDPTCVEDGYTTYTCPACQKSEVVTDVGSADGEHNYTGVEGVYVAPTPAEDGHWEKECADCGHIEKYDYDNSMLGDVNEDGRITIADAVILLRQINGAAQAPNTIVNLYASDVNGDNQLTAEDVQLIMQKLNGWNVEFVVKNGEENE